MKEGFKNTGANRIPDGWELDKIGSVCKLVNGRGFKPFEWKTSGLPIIRIQNLNGSNDFNYFDGSYDPKIEVNTGQLLYAWSGSRGTSFGPHIWSGPCGLLNYHTWKVQVDESKMDADFFFHTLKKLTEFIEGRAHGASALVHTQKWEMEGFIFDFPISKEEQRAIATALSDVDALIESLDRLIAKKRDLKQAAMQELLTGKRRLPGFEGEWEEKRLGDIVDFLDGKRRPVKDIDRTKMTGDVPYYGASGIVDFVSGYLFDEPLILLGEDGENIISRNCRLAFKISGKAWVNNHAHVLRPKEHIDIDFLTEYLESLNYEQYNTGTAQPKLNKKTCYDIPIMLPLTTEEQTAIATILSDMDAEIEALEARRAKTVDLKQGMMQELLTGKTRLV